MPSSATADVCAHCGLPVPPGRVGRDTRVFCCAGCRMVADALRDAGLEQFYRIRTEARPGPDPQTLEHYRPLDDDAFLAASARTEPDGCHRITLGIENLHCVGCIWLVERLPRVVDGVRSARVDLPRGLVTLSWDPARVSLARVATTLHHLGHPTHPDRDADRRAVRRQQERRHILRIGVAGACAANVMTIAFALYGGAFEGMDAELRRVLRLTSLALTVVAVAGPGRVFYRGALASLRGRVLHMDVPVAIALSAGVIWGAVNTMRGSGEVYFESLTAIIFLLLVGRWLQDRHRWSAEESVAALYRITPERAWRLGPGDRTTRVPVVALRRGDRVRVPPGAAVPADGTIERGSTQLDCSRLTGESMPVPAERGDDVDAGSVNLDASIDVQVERVGPDSRLGRVLNDVRSQLATRAPVVALADRIAHVFVLIVLALAAATIAIWWKAGPAVGIEHAIALLIVTCPCALGLATPLAITAAVGRAARAGMLIKSGAALEQLSRDLEIVLDKTGTVTEGRCALVDWIGDPAVRPLVLALERDQDHPFAVSMRERWPALSSAAPVEETSRLPGGGWRGRVAGRRMVVGSPRGVTLDGARIPEWATRATSDAVARGRSPMMIACDDAVVALATFEDTIHGDAADAIGRLRRLAGRIRLVSGDHTRVVTAVGRQIGLADAETVGEADPQRKVAFVQARQGGDATVVMVGDGVNDAAALVVADVGVAVRGGAEASLVAADVFLSRPGVTPLLDLITGARRTMRVIRRNLAVSLGYNAVAATLAMAGVITPLLAAVLMPISSLTLVSLSYRARTFDPPHRDAASPAGGAR
ncbi:MAG: heavy metal translocating P-type ATPase [Phycisphaerales bacterium]|nr:heavy metal translocating P-type ATPase [Phycisphaerales bacterium]